MTEPATPSPPRRESWRMFDRISPCYDRLNRIISAGLDGRWRRRMADRLPAGPDLRVLDLATGTGDQLLAVLATGRVREGVGLDLAERMLEVGRAKFARRPGLPPTRLGVGDAMAIPEPDAAFDAVTISFGIRNVPDVPLALREMHRVLKPGGRLLVLESSVPTWPPVRAVYLFYIRHIMPTVAGWLSGDRDAYRYLNVTMEQFPHGPAFCRLLEQAGFAGVQAHPQCFGSVSIYQGDRPGAGA